MYNVIKSSPLKFACITQIALTLNIIKSFLLVLVLLWITCPCYLNFYFTLIIACSELILVILNQKSNPKALCSCDGTLWFIKRDCIVFIILWWYLIAIKQLRTTMGLVGLSTQIATEI